MEKQYDFDFQESYFSHVGRPEDCDDDEDVAAEATEDHEAVEAGQSVEGRIPHRLVVQDTLKSRKPLVPGV